MLEEQQVAIEFQGISTPEGEFLMGESYISKAPTPRIPECVSLFLCLYMFAAAIILWDLAW